MTWAGSGVSRMIKYQFNSAALDAKIKEVGTHSPQMAKALLAFARVLRTRIQLGFRLGKAPDGSSWAKLKWRAGQPLKDRGILYASFQARPDGDSVLVGSNLHLPNSTSSLGAVHQYGMTIKPKKGPYLVFPGPNGNGMVFAKQVTIPARPMMPLDKSGAVKLPPAWEISALNSMGRALGLQL